MMGKLQLASAKMYSADDFIELSDGIEYEDGKMRFNRNGTGLSTDNQDILAWYNTLTKEQKEAATVDDYVMWANANIANGALTADEAVYFNS